MQFYPWKATPSSLTYGRCYKGTLWGELNFINRNKDMGELRTFLRGVPKPKFKSC